MSIQVINFSSIENHQGKTLNSHHPTPFKSFRRALRKRSRMFYENINYSPLCDAQVTDSLLNRRKLYLVLDLDLTLLNSTRLVDLKADEDYLKSAKLSRGGLFRLDNLGMVTKLRPFVHKFLEEASKLFELCIFTLADRGYATEMAKLLDPQNIYFKSRIFSQENCTQKDKKRLDVLNIPEKFVLVLDDTTTVWKNHKENLILMDRYCYFSSSCRDLGMKNCKSLSQRMRDEDEFDGALATILRVVQRLHSEFFANAQHSSVSDVRRVLKTARKEVLKGCKIVFSGVFSRNFVAADNRLWKMAEDMGATCSDAVDSSVTHVVAGYSNTEKAIWAAVEGKFLVNPGWVEAAYVLWRRQIEDLFPVNQLPEKNKINIGHL